MNNKVTILCYIFIIMIGGIIYLQSVYFKAYDFSCNDAFVYIDKEKNERLEGNVAVTLADNLQGSAEIVGRLIKNSSPYDVIRSVSFKYRIVSQEKLTIYNVKNTIYASDSVNNTFIPDPFLDFLFFRSKELNELSAVMRKFNDTYFFGRGNNIMFSCTL